jgi:hypothetical protein
MSGDNDFRFRFDGRDGNDNPYRSEWRNRSWNRDRNQSWDRWDQNRTFSDDGDGSLRIGNVDRDLDRAVLELKTDRRFVLKVYGEKNYSFSGRYTRAGNNIKLDINDSTGLSDADGQGTVIIDGRESLSSIRLDGRNEGKRFTVNFRENRSNGRDRDENRGRGRGNGWGNGRS